MEMKHFSHEHPLILKDAPKADDREVICYGCERPISEVEPSYRCGDCSKDYFLHKVCAQLPREIMHPKHVNTLSSFCPDHLIEKHLVAMSAEKFFVVSPTTAPSVNLIALKENDTFCTFKNRTIKHDSHEHSLILQPRPALFRCDACGVEDKDQSYLCPSCPFSIHKSCASLPRTAKREGHDHTLSLAFDLPSDYENFRFDCDICRQRIFTQYWVYYCRLCRYFVHLKCMTTDTHQIEANLDDDILDDANFEQKLLKVLIDDDLLHLPMTNISEELIKRFLLRKNSLAQVQPEIKHPSHMQHSLILFHEQQNDKDIEEDEERLCNGCVEPVSAPYYSCVECRYFLHLPCAKLPYRLQHLSHPHPLKLSNYPKFYDTYRCNNCYGFSNGFFFFCETCDFFLDIMCAALPTVIEHENHDHPLFQFEASDKVCNACDFIFDGLGFGCESCDFNLDHGCAMLPRAIRHRWDKHPLPLRFPPYSDHPDDFYCDICEEEMHPKFWLYHCSECDNSFHPDCVPTLGRVPHIKFGGIVELSSHPHALEFKRKATLKSSCRGCGADLDRYIVFECEDCNFYLCRPCIRTMS